MCISAAAATPTVLRAKPKSRSIPTSRAVTLFVDGKEFAAQDGDKIFKFTVPISGEHTIEARSGACSDTIAIRKSISPTPPT